MKWYRALTKQQQQSFKKVVTICIIGVVLILLIPTILHFN